MKCSKREQKQVPANNSRDITDMLTGHANNTRNNH